MDGGCDDRLTRGAGELEGVAHSQGPILPTAGTPTDGGLRAALHWAALADSISVVCFRERSGRRSWCKEDGTLVSVADVLVEQALRTAILRRFPRDIVVGEEGGDTGSRPPGGDGSPTDALEGWALEGRMLAGQGRVRRVGSAFRQLTAEELAEYRRPYPTAASRRPLLAWARQIPVAGDPADVGALLTRAVEHLAGSRVPVLLVRGRPGAVVGDEVVEWLGGTVPRLQVADVGESSHFLPEDRPHDVAAALRRWWGSAG